MVEGLGPDLPVISPAGGRGLWPKQIIGAMQVYWPGCEIVIAFVWGAIVCVLVAPSGHVTVT